jgi:glycosyltransferase involved in cell wall biosynthesis
MTIRPRTAQTSRGRVVMLVDNGVVGDSRVQKQARSAAAAGWDVTLVGLRDRSSSRTTWSIGGAEVRLVTVPTAYAHRATQFRRSVRRPFAYPAGQVPLFRQARVRSVEVEIVAGLGELAQARRAGRPGWRHVAGHLGLLPTRLRLKIIRPWYRFRAGQLTRLRRVQGDPANWFTQFHARFWTTVSGKRVWRRLDPGLWDFELAMGSVIDKLQPDIIHANDHRMLSVGARAKLRAAANGRRVKLVWDAHEFVPGLNPRPGNPRWLPAQVAHEREYARHHDAVVTVSPMLADLLRTRHRLTELPAVVLNAPDDAPAVPQPKPGPTDGTENPGPSGDEIPDIRTLCGIGPDTPLLAYCGGISKMRGLDLVVDALPQLPGVHVVMVSLHPNGGRRAADEVEVRARALGVADRLHLLPYMPHWQVVPFLAGADAALSPLRHLPNHEIALSNKFFEYSQARLPLVVSDVKAMAEMVRSTGQGEVFRVDDLEDFSRAVRAVLADPERYRAAYDQPGLLERWRWSEQATLLDQVYARVMG